MGGLQKRAHILLLSSPFGRHEIHKSKQTQKEEEEEKKTKQKKQKQQQQQQHTNRINSRPEE